MVKNNKKKVKVWFQIFKKTSSSPLDMIKNLHLAGSIFHHKLAFLNLTQ
jgi:hypothetical protein